MKKKLTEALQSFFLHGIILTVLSILLVADVVITKAKRPEDISMFGAVVSALFVIDIVGYVGFTIVKMTIDWIRDRN